MKYLNEYNDVSGLEFTNDLSNNIIDDLSLTRSDVMSHTRITRARSVKRSYAPALDQVPSEQMIDNDDDWNRKPNGGEPISTGMGASFNQDNRDSTDQLSLSQ